MVEYEFGGPVGALGIIFGLPLVVYFLFFGCQENCALTPECATSVLNGLKDVGGLLSARSVELTVYWISLCVLLERVLPYEAALGAPLKQKNGLRLKYRLSAHLQFWVTAAILAFGAVELAPESLSVRRFGPLPLAELYDEYLGLLTASLLVSFGLSLYLYVSALLKPSEELAEGGQTNNVVYDFFIGRELNPRIGDFDLKEFCELRPGMGGERLGADMGAAAA
eukprot:scaffold7766_cov277-Pinguiococcus_pyrenoidosus.AAC.4